MGADDKANPPEGKMSRRQFQFGLGTLLGGVTATGIGAFLVGKHNRQQSLDAELRMACQNGEDAEVEDLLKMGASAKARFEGERTLLHESSITEKAIDLLIEYGADINAQDDLGNTPLHSHASLILALYAPNPLPVYKLLDKNPDLNIENNNQQTPLTDMLDNMYYRHTDAFSLNTHTQSDIDFWIPKFEETLKLAELFKAKNAKVSAKDQEKLNFIKDFIEKYQANKSIINPTTAIDEPHIKKHEDVQLEK